MTNTAFILLLVFFLHGGLIETKAIVAHSQQDCNEAQLPIVRTYMQSHTLATGGMWSLNKKTTDIDYIESQCIKVEHTGE